MSAARLSIRIRLPMYCVVGDMRRILFAYRDGYLKGPGGADPANYAENRGGTYHGAHTGHWDCDERIRQWTAIHAW